MKLDISNSVSTVSLLFAKEKTHEIFLILFLNTNDGSSSRSVSLRIHLGVQFQVEFDGVWRGHVSHDQLRTIFQFQF